MTSYYKNTIEFVKKLKIVTKENLIVNQYIMENIYRLKRNPVMKNSMQIFTIVRYQEEVLNLVVYTHFDQF